ncbi:MAG TPA: bifunctional metallophosphatase/5'-nucleotidase [Bradyrhizobium sp.]|nr:bifunctional metallophosphatase/5'-nucleotidase [Bradyrhizobium sp.]
MSRMLSFKSNGAAFRKILARFFHGRIARYSPAPNLILLTLLIVPGVLSPVRAQTAAVDLRILAINDFHGYLRAPSGGIRITDPADSTKKIAIAAGGAEHMATLVKQLKQGHKNTIFVAAGDLIGASPLLSAMFHDEPTIESLSIMGLQLAAVGNHEFDGGKDELKRMQNGGCHPLDTCQGPHPFSGAKFHYLAASTVETASGKTIFPPYEIREFDGIPVAFIGLTLKGTAGIISPATAAGLEFRDEAESVNALVPELKAHGIEAIVVLIHEGGYPTGDYNECPAISGAIIDIVKKFDRAIDLVISGHTHQAYVCEIDGRLVTSADKYGTLVTAIDVKLDGKSHDIISAKADNVIVRNTTLPKDPQQSELIAAYDRLAAPIANRRAGSVASALSRAPNDAGESSLGDVIADAQLAATATQTQGGAVMAFTNPGGLRADITGKEDGTVTYADVFASQPFRNQLVTLSLSGSQIKTMLEQQWLDPKRPRILQVSKGFSYAWDNTKPYGEHVIAASMALNSEPIDPSRRYRVTVNNYLSSGGDGFSALTAGIAPQFGAYDADALYAYFQTHSPISPAPADRIKRSN